MNIILSFKDLFDLSVVFMPNAFEIGRHHSLMLHTRETFCQALVYAVYRSNCQQVGYNACCCSRRSYRPVSSHLWMHCCSDFCNQEFVQTSSAKHVMLNSP